MSTASEPSAKRTKPSDDTERSHLLTTLLQYQASRKSADATVAVSPAEAACEAQLRDRLTAAVLLLPPSKVVSKSALAVFKQQHMAVSRVAEAALLSKLEPASGEAAPPVANEAANLPPPQTPVKTES